MPTKSNTARRKRRGQGEGSVYQRKSDGLWIAAVTLPDGRRKTVSAHTQSEAIDKRDAIKVSMARGVLPNSATVGEWLDYWLDVILPGDLKPSTIDRYRGYVEHKIKPELGGVKLQDLTVDHVRALLRKVERSTSRRGGHPLSPRTVAKTRTVLQSALSRAVKDRRLLFNPVDMTDPPKLKKEPALRRLTPDEARAVIDHTTGARERARLAVALMAGLRQGEALALRWEDVRFAADGLSAVLDVDEGATRVRGMGMHVDTPKTVRSIRYVEVGAAAARMLAAWRDESGGVGLVFPHRHRPGEVEDGRRDWQEWADALDRAGVDHVRLQDARGTAESIMAGVVPVWVAAEMMGHSPEVAQRYYNRSSPEQRSLAAGATDGLAGGS